MGSPSSPTKSAAWATATGTRSPKTTGAAPDVTLDPGAGAAAALDELVPDAATSGDPTSPYFSDQTELFAAKQWRPILFSEAAIAADPDLRE